MINTEADYLHRAMQAYDNPACISLEEFQYDLNGNTTIHRAIKKYMITRENLQRLVNHVIIFYNCFGKDATDLLLFKIKEPELGVLIPIISHLGWLDSGTLNVSIDSQTVIELQEIFK
jgi:hypothetical protein